MRPRNVLVVILAVMLGAAAIFALRQLREPVAETSRDIPLTLPPPPEINTALIDDLLPRDSIQSIDEPIYESSAEADRVVDPDERVIGLIINGDARAYPINILSNHEIVNDVVGGEAVAITWCPLCFSALVFSREVAGQDQPLDFGVSGKLLYNTLVMFDRQTGTLWSQLYGAGIDGSLEGTVLAVFPSQLTEWDSWKRQYPGTLVLSKTGTCEQFNCGTYATNPRGSYDIDPYESYYNTPLEGVINNQIPRDAAGRSVKRRVLGVRVGDRARAYPFDILEELRLVNDNLNNTPLLVWFDPVTQTGLIYNRRVDGDVLAFTLDPADPLFLIDDLTDSKWLASTGEAVDGPLAGKQLADVVSTPAFEFGWFDYFSHSDAYSPDL
ncbi:MAG: DUF3179 domain-containing protein [Anaerolineales bacterium]|nr:DUF3179 domain-containing protein [Anaerolineales bacterium]